MIHGFESDSLPDTGPAQSDASPKAKPRDRWWLLPALLLAGFGLLLWQVETNGPVTTLDARVRDHIQRWAQSPSMGWTFHIGRGMADLGNQSVSLIVLLVVTVLVSRTAHSWRPVLVSLGALAALATVVPLKIWIDRTGPTEVALGDAQLGFFPSGHTADAILCYGTCALLICVFVIPDNPRARRRRQLTAAAACVLVAATIFGLLWSNFHWLSDTVGSLCWCGAAFAVLYRVTTSPQRVRVRPRRPSVYPQ